jgi:hypothetical protein
MCSPENHGHLLKIVYTANFLFFNVQKQVFRQPLLALLFLFFSYDYSFLKHGQINGTRGMELYKIVSQTRKDTLLNDFLYFRLQNKVKLL